MTERPGLGWDAEWFLLAAVGIAVWVLVLLVLVGVFGWR